MIRVRPVAPSPYINGVIYGEHGSGKSTLAATASLVPDMQDVLVLSVESGEMSVETFEMDTIHIENFNDLSMAFKFMQAHCSLRDSGDDVKLKALQDMVMDERPTIARYKTVIIDSLSELQKYAMYQILGIAPGETDLDAELPIAQFAHWNRNAEKIRFLVRGFRDLPMNVIFILGTIVTQDEFNRRFVAPRLPGQLAREIQGFVDLVGYLDAAILPDGGMARRLYINPGNSFQAKNRFRSAINFIDNPTMAKILEVRRAGLTKDQLLATITDEETSEGEEAQVRIIK